MNKKLIRKARLNKIAQQKKDQSGFFSHYNTEIENSTRQKKLREFGKPVEEDSRYNLQFNQEDSESEISLSENPLSTRNFPGTSRQARRVGDGVYQDPITNKVVDFNASFESGGEAYPGGSPSLQSSIMYLTSNLKQSGQKKYAKKILAMMHDLTLIK
jgi:hypothetical protein